jgi:molecular chaperone DnaJ
MADEYYTLLGVAKSASADELKKAYRKKAMEFHPDQNKGNKEAEEKFKKINEAYSVLNDPEKRQRYDSMGHSNYAKAEAGGGPTRSSAGGAGFGSNAQDLFDAIRQTFGAHGQGGPRVPPRVDREVSISLEEAAGGVERTIRYEKVVLCGTCNGSKSAPGKPLGRCGICKGQGYVRGIFGPQECPQCEGTGQTVTSPCQSCRGIGLVVDGAELKVTIPAGIDQGQSLRKVGYGNIPAPGYAAGDLYIFVNVTDHALFERSGADLYCVIPVKFSVAALGGKVQVPKLKGKTVLSVPAGTQSGETIRLKGEGMPKLGGKESGDLLVRISIDVPKKMTDKEKEALKAYAAACGDEAAPVSESWRSKFKEFFR